ncbi:MAG: FAD-binding protein, partial [Deltaproteobacteria bacterium]|nr:FAD-binding protein [Deltaproteobacteria bacterium]
MELNQKRHDFSSRNLITTTASADGPAGASGPVPYGAGIGKIPASWDLEADVVVIGSGAAGLPAAIKAADGGASVIVVETNYDVGGHGIISGGNVPLGGGTSAQKKYGI